MQCGTAWLESRPLSENQRLVVLRQVGELGCSWRWLKSLARNRRAHIIIADIRTRRIYDPAAPADGARVLVDRIWPWGGA
ncbi:hypothetical protein [Methylocapsa aurea]|uniref:DUF488 family protein, N3 subclade n=1 Tax=Methylocapsa aurea TaxID=663610 RepID=UPI003CC9E263